MNLRLPFLRLPFLSIILSFGLFLCTLQGNAKTLRVLFLGNSYTSVNNLPLMVYQATQSAGDTLIYDWHAPGGQTLRYHELYDSISQSKIAAQQWDYVVLQEQSQLPSLPCNIRSEEVYNAAMSLSGTISGFGTGCKKVMFYMTWGRKNGDASFCSSWPPSCTYQSMDSVIHTAYMEMSENKGEVSPVGAVWKYIRTHHPEIELYSSDESHPSVAGTFAGACTFYAALFRKSPLSISYNPGLDTSTLRKIKNAAYRVVSLSPSTWRIGDFDPRAEFYATQPDPAQPRQIEFNNISRRYGSCKWLFGDGTTSTETSPTHTFPADSQYTVQLIVYDCHQSLSDTFRLTLNFGGPQLSVQDWIQDLNIRNTLYSGDTLHFLIPVAEDSISRNLLLNNLGLQELLCAAPLITGTDSGYFFMSVNDSITVSSFSTSSFQLKYKPQSSGIHEAHLLLLSNDADVDTFHLVLRGSREELSTAYTSITSFDALLLFPNPCDGNFTVQSQSGIKSIRLFSMEGKLVYETLLSPTEQNHAIRTSLPAGMYMLMSETKSGWMRKKLLVQ